MDILMPQLGETVAEGKITTWFKAIGDAVKPGDNLFEIETDKVSMEVPATSAGTLTEIRVAAGEVAPVGAVVAIVAGEAEPAAEISSDTVTAGAQRALQTALKRADGPVNLSRLISSKAGSTITSQAVGQWEVVPAARVLAVEEATGVSREELRPDLYPRSASKDRVSSDAKLAQSIAQPPAPIVLDPFREVRTPERNWGPARLATGATVTPLARRLAGQAGIDLTRIVASGPHGRIVARDVETAIASAPASVAAPRPAPSADRIKALYPEGSYEEVPLDSMRRTIATRLVEAVQTIPHFYLSTDVVIERLEAVRKEANESTLPGLAGEPAPKLSLNDFIIKALALALLRVPAANAVWAEDRILRFKSSDIGVAVAIDGGLVTPVVRQADKKTLLDISAEVKDLAARARARKLKPAELAGGASAVSNLGMYGIREFSAIINPPHATILAAGAGIRRPVETADGGIAFVSQMTVTLSCDHRVVDGVVGAELLAAFRHFIEHPVGLMI
jgi:pyruvate dehydrogenase E2 component (dihydrolipoamide acetyltransferase)